MPSTMTHWQRIRAAIDGRPTDRPPISLWRHWPNADETALGLAYGTLFWQREYDFDLVKVTPASGYMHVDWGTESKYLPNAHGTRTTLRRVVASPEAWPQLPVLDPSDGCLGQQVEAIRIIAEELEDSAPILQTIFSPLTTAWKLAGDRMFSDLRRHPDLLTQGLEVIAETTADLAVASAEAGATGMFFATQCDTYRLMTEAQYREFGETYDRIVLGAVRDKVEIIMMHAHGEDIMFDLLAGYPIDAINWHDRLAGPSLAEAWKRFPGLLVGGINEWTTLLDGPAEAIVAEIEDAVAQAGGPAHVVGAGCVVPITTPHAHIRAARDAVDTM